MAPVENISWRNLLRFRPGIKGINELSLSDRAADFLAPSFWLLERKPQNIDG